MAKVQALALADLPVGGMKELELEGEVILLVHLEDGIYALGGICTHAHVHLAEGSVEGGKTLCCPQHGGKFDIESGKAVAFPAVTKLETFAVSVAEGMIYVEIDE